MEMREVYYPQNERLKKYIRYISSYKSSQQNRQYFVFPNSGSAMVLGKDSNFEFLERNTYITEEVPGSYINTIHLNRIDPVKIIESGTQEKITIVFKPYGLNHFIDCALSDLLNDGDPTHIPVENSKHFPGFSKQVYSLPSVTERLSFIEEYLLKKYMNIQIPCIENAVALLTDMDHSYTIAEICKKIGTSPRNLSRLFNKHICLSPVEFRNIYQFRHSLEKKITAKDRLSFKDIGYESNYNDASYMIRMYKKYTGNNPSAFFNKINVEGEGNYVFLTV